MVSDVIVVGAGLAGSAAACRASELGRSVVLVDAAEDPTAGGNTTLSTGGMHVGPRLDPTADDAEAIAARLEQRTAGEARPEIVEAIAGNAARAIAWLQTQGPELLPRTPGDLYPRLGPTKRDVHDIHDWRDKGPQQTLRALQDTVRARGGEVRGATRITALDRDGDGAIAGVVAEDGTRLAGRAVVLADGGFGADPELRRRHIGPAADRLFLRGAPSGRGDALRMGETAGARLAHLDWFYGHCLHGDVFDNDRLWPWPGLDEVMTTTAASTSTRAAAAWSTRASAAWPWPTSPVAPTIPSAGSSSARSCGTRPTATRSRATSPPTPSSSGAARGSCARRTPTRWPRWSASTATSSPRRSRSTRRPRGPGAAPSCRCRAPAPRARSTARWSPSRWRPASRTRRAAC